MVVSLKDPDDPERNRIETLLDTPGEREPEQLAVQRNGVARPETEYVRVCPPVFFTTKVRVFAMLVVLVLKFSKEGVTEI